MYWISSSNPCKPKITQVETIYGRSGLRMAVRRGPKSVGAGLAYGLFARFVCAPLQLQLPLVAIYKCYAFLPLPFTKEY